MMPREPPDMQEEAGSAEAFVAKPRSQDVREKQEYLSQLKNKLGDLLECRDLAEPGSAEHCEQQSPTQRTLAWQTASRDQLYH
ncbi:uncharacterized protein LOC129734361 isoform X2 [Falco cherrug]|uniref:uncharacterized protein LOC129734361 isoform X2 n=1 Tax=Falco cherrug TaxID=345164 RepID=UPI002479742E|nr:uncharacterized protein LOC129734361 isoform X2 [Falco cherrug]